MRNYDLSVIIPARNEIYLENTIRNVLENIRGNTEIIVVLDGYIPEPQIITNDERVYFIHNEESRGQRQSINQAARFSNSKFVMKLDAHCAVAEGFDVQLMKDCEYDMTMIPRMYNLDVKNWLPKRHKLTDYMYIGLRDNGQLRAEYYTGREYKRQHDKTAMIDDIMCCMGPGFFMHRDRFFELDGCDESHGSWGSQGIEVACKAWLSGGRLVVNKNTWFAHWFRGDIGFPYPISGKQVEHARKYSKDLWLNNKWPKQTRQFQFLLDKFNPPGWNSGEKLVLNLGCGNRPMMGATNIDIRVMDGVDVVSDLMTLPFKDGEADEIHSTDVIEHFKRRDIAPLLKEWHRALKVGGKMEIMTVDAKLAMERLGRINWERIVDCMVGAQNYEHDYHKMIFSKESLIKYLEDAGFKINSVKRFTLGHAPRIKVICTKTA